MFKKNKILYRKHILILSTNLINHVIYYLEKKYMTLKNLSFILSCNFNRTDFCKLRNFYYDLVLLTWFPTKKTVSNSGTFLDFFSLFPWLFASKFQDYSRTFRDFYRVVLIAATKFLFCKIKTYILYNIYK